jgi:putative drug exporter of the RND superfamily
MATFLYRLGRTAFRHRTSFALAWLLILVLGGVGAATLSGPTSDSFNIPGTESQKAIDLLGERMPQAAADSAEARVVFTTDGSGTVTDPARTAAIEKVVTDLKQDPRVANVTDPIATKTIAPDQRTAYTTVTYTVAPIEITEADRTRLFETGDRAESAGLTVDYGGTVAQEQPAQSPAEVIGIGVAAVVLVITFGSLLAAGLPLVTALVGVGLGVLGVQVATGFFELSSTTPTLALMLGLAVGIDYALFIVSRYRHELLSGREPEDAIGRALGTAGSSVVFAGLTVVIALAALSVVGIPFLTSMGLAAAGTVLVAVIIALTLLPALLGFLGRRVLGRSGKRARDAEAAPNVAMGERWSRLVLRRRRPVLIAAVVGLGLIAVPATDLRLGLPSDASAAPASTQRQAYDALAEGFGPGFSGPLLIAVDVAGVDTGGRKEAVEQIAEELPALPDVATVAPAVFGPEGDIAIVTVIPKSGPSSSETEDLVHTIRDRASGWEADTGAGVYVTGETAVGIDVSEKLSSALLPYLVIVVGLAFLLLMLVFRSLLVPLKATAGFLLTVVATFGAVVAVFQWGWLTGLLGVASTGPIISFLPILLIGVLFGLAMDYEVFLVTRMREEHVHGASAQEAIALGFRHGARVVTAAAVIMASVFAGFILSDESIIKSIGFALAFGVLVDAFVVRMTLVPAVMSLLGERAWYLPAWLDRALPDVDVEGEKLTRALRDDKELVKTS